MIDDLWLSRKVFKSWSRGVSKMLLGRAQPVIPPNLYFNVNEHNSLGSQVKKYTDIAYFHNPTANSLLLF